MPVSHANHHSFVSPYIMNKNRVVTLKGKSLEESILCCDYFETPKLTDIDWGRNPAFCAKRPICQTSSLFVF